MRITTGYEHRKARIEMVPLFDVVLQLLVFFIYLVGSMNLYHGVDVRLPSAEGRQTSRDSFVITLTSDNRYVVNGVETDLDKAVGLASDWVSAGHKGVNIEGDRNAGLGNAVELLSRLRSAGVGGVSFLVEKERPGGQTR